MKYYQELHSLLAEYGKLLQPASYLEIGVQEGDSLLCLLKVCVPQRVVLCDNWGTAAGGTGRGSHAHITALLAQENIPILPAFLDGDSHTLVKTLTQHFQFVTVDGDHSPEGGRQDLEDAWPLLETNGLLFFDDIFHPTHPYLFNVMQEFAAKLPDARLLRVEHEPNGTPGCAVLHKTAQ